MELNDKRLSKKSILKSSLGVFFSCLVLAVQGAHVHRPLEEGSGGRDRLTAPHLEPARELGVPPTHGVHRQEPQQALRLLHHSPGSCNKP